MDRNATDPAIQERRPKATATLRRLGKAALAACLATTAMGASAIEVLNGSFESPETIFVNTQVESWQDFPEPEGFDESGGFSWDQLTGIFKNPEPGTPGYLANAHGVQALWIFAVPGAGLFQDLESPSTPATGVVFEPGQSYRLTVGVVGGGGGMLPGATLELSIYYRDADDARVAVAAESIAHDAGLFSDSTQLIDFEVATPVVDAQDPWAGRRIGIALESTVSEELQGGYWDLDHVRFTEAAESRPILLNPVWTANPDRFTFTVQSNPGARIEILETGDLSAAATDWITVGAITNASGTAQFSVPNPKSAPRFFRARRLP